MKKMKKDECVSSGSISGLRMNRRAFAQSLPAAGAVPGAESIEIFDKKEKRD